MLPVCRRNTFHECRLVKQNGSLSFRENALKSISRKLGSGMAYENYIASLPEFKNYRLPANFKTFDFWNQDRGIATSIKTLNTGATTYTRDPKQIYYRIKGYVDKTLNFKSYPNQYTGKDLLNSEIKQRNIHIGIPANTTSRQMEEIMKAVDYGKLNNVNIVVRKVGK